MEKSIKENTYYFCALMNSSPFWTELCIVMESCKDNFAFILENGNTGAPSRRSESWYARADLTLLFAGWPSSSVSWWRAGQVVDTSWEEISPGKSRNTMKLEQLTRQDMNSRLECRGNNNNHTQPVLANIAINMNCEFPPAAINLDKREIFVSIWPFWAPLLIEMNVETKVWSLSHTLYTIHSHSSD